jgi:hypothetical protein
MKFALLFLSIFLTACHPSYTAEQSEKFARKLGVINQLEIQRWNTRVLSAKSSLAVAVSAVPTAEFESGQSDVKSMELLALAQSAFNKTFARVSLIEGEHAAASALSKANSLGAGFLIHLELVPVGDQQSSRQHWVLAVTVYDTAILQVVDKALLTATGAKLSFWRDENLALLEEPLRRLANDLAGKPY